jgi:hypothetical protein
VLLLSGYFDNLYTFPAVTFGFDATQYMVRESAPFVTVTVHQTSGGALDRNVVVLLKTGDGTAICEWVSVVTSGLQ